MGVRLCCHVEESIRREPIVRPDTTARAFNMDLRRPRLLIINNMPAFYRTAPFAALVRRFEEETGGVGLVAYQVRRDPHGRGEWFYTPDPELPYAHYYASAETRASNRRTGYPLRLSAELWRRFRPTHVLAAGWDSPLALGASLWAASSGARLCTWVESNPSTSRQKSHLSNIVRRAILRPASTILVPTRASEQYVRSLAKRDVHVVHALNPVTCERLAGEESSTRRLIFLGDLSRRKGFDVLQEALRQSPESGWKGVAWGRDVDGLASDSPTSLDVRGPAPLRDVIPHISSGDTWVIPSRVDPAPLVYSEALAMGLRVIVSESIAYSDHARNVAGAATVDIAHPQSLLRAADFLSEGGRPSVASAQETTPHRWADVVYQALVAGAR